MYGFIRAVRSAHIERPLRFVYALIIAFSVFDIVWPPVWIPRPGPYGVLAIIIGGISAVGAILAVSVVNGGWWRLERLGLWAMLLGFCLQVPLALLLSSSNQLWVSPVAGAIGFCVLRMAVIWTHDYAPNPGVHRE